MAQEDLVQEQRQEQNFAPGSVLLKSALTIIEYTGFGEEGETISGLIIVPNGSATSMLGLIAQADTRFRAEEVASLFGGQ